MASDFPPQWDFNGPGRWCYRGYGADLGLLFTRPLRQRGAAPRLAVIPGMARVCWPDMHLSQCTDNAGQLRRTRGSPYGYGAPPGHHLGQVSPHFIMTSEGSAYGP